MKIGQKCHLSLAKSLHVFSLAVWTDVHIHSSHLELVFSSAKKPHPGIDQTQLLCRAITRAVPSEWTTPGCFSHSHQHARQALPMPPPGWLRFSPLNAASQEKVYYFSIN